HADAALDRQQLLKQLERVAPSAALRLGELFIDRVILAETALVADFLNDDALALGAADLIADRRSEAREDSIVRLIKGQHVRGVLLRLQSAARQSLGERAMIEAYGPDQTGRANASETCHDAFHDSAMELAIPSRARIEAERTE